jgi:hypothetical protein
LEGAAFQFQCCNSAEDLDWRLKGKSPGWGSGGYDTPDEMCRAVSGVEVDVGGEYWTA